MPATSKRQFRFMKGIAEGTIEPKGSLTKAVATEFVSNQTQAGLPERVAAKARRRRKWGFR